MARRIRVKLILELRAAGMSRNAIARTRKMSKSSVCEVFDLADELGIGFEEVRDKNHDEAYHLLYPERNTPRKIYEDPDWDYVHKELAKVGVTLKLLHSEYVDKCIDGGNISMGYNRFCEQYSSFAYRKSLTSHVDHRPGEKCEVDWSGPTLKLIHADTAEITTVYLFVANLPYSQYSYVEPTLDMKQNTWLRCHVRMFSYFEGSTTRLVCDNLKTGVIRHPKEGEIVLNEAYERLGEHYLCAIMPAPVRRPKAKASVEGTVGKVATAIIAKLRNRIFSNFDELRCAVSEKLEEFNAGHFQKREHSRKIVFEAHERAALRVLPAIPYEIADWVYGRKANLNCHIIWKKNHYSCPHRLVGDKVDLRITDTVLEIYHSGERVATHKVFPEYIKNVYSTRKEDMPDGLIRPEWDDKRIKGWAEGIGYETACVIERIFSNVKIKEQAYNPSLAVLRLGKTYTPERLECACRIAIGKITSPRYRHLKQILETDQDKLLVEADWGMPTDEGGHVRGADYYGSGE